MKPFLSVPLAWSLALFLFQGKADQSISLRLIEVLALVAEESEHCRPTTPVDRLPTDTKNNLAAQDFMKQAQLALHIAKMKAAKLLTTP